jgi:hypothetical protein
MLTQLGAIPNQMFQQQPVIKNSTPNEMMSSTSSVESTNNALNTFQTIEKGKVDNSDKQTSKLGEAIANATKSSNSGSDSKATEGNTGVALSDERCKELFGKDCNLLSAIADLDEYVYKYKESAKNNPALEGKGADDGTFVGPMAQDLAENPVTKDCVHEDPESGFLTVDTKHLSLTEMSLISMLAKRVEAIEEILKEKK